MKNPTWTPDKPHKQTTNRHVDDMNQAPLVTIGAILVALFCLFVAIILATIF